MAILVKRVVACWALILFCHGLFAAPIKEKCRFTVRDQGIEREYFLYIPDCIAGVRNAPLVFSLHGYGGTAWDNFPDLISTAEREGFAICYPQGAIDPNNYPAWEVGYPFQKGAKVDDVKFLCRLAKLLQKQYGFDPQGTFVTGMSNGGEMCYILAARAADTFRAVAPIAGLQMQWAYEQYAPTTPVPLMEVHGTKDTISWWDGDLKNKGGWGEYISVPLAVTNWAAINRCLTEETIELPLYRPDGLKVILHKYVGGADGCEVRLYEVVGGEHGHNNGEMDTAAEVWSFFKQYLPNRKKCEIVNTMIGTGGDGLRATFLYPGATYPFGMVQFTPTFREPQCGFTGLLLSGVGCWSLGQFPVLPQNGNIEQSPSHMFNWKNSISGQKGSAGHYQCTIDNAITTELSVTKRSGMARMKRNNGHGDMSFAIGVGFEMTNGEIGRAEGRINSEGAFEGHAIAHDFCSAADTPFDIYYYAEFDRKPSKYGSWKDGDIYPDSDFATGQESGIYLSFADCDTLHYKFALSFVSMENAKENLRSENPGWDFDAVHRSAEDAWEKYLSMVDVKGDDYPRIEQFYTHLYHSLIHPSLCSDVCGEYMGSDFKVHKVAPGHNAYHMFSNWDTYRTQCQIVSMLAPDVMSDIVTSHANFANFCSGGMPRWTMANYETNVMQGDPGSAICATAWAFGARDFDKDAVAKAMYRTAEDVNCKSQVFPARPNLDDYLKCNGNCPPSMTLEYAIADYAIAQYALNAMGDAEKYKYYVERSHSWRKFVNPDTHWIQGLSPEGEWLGWHARWNEFQEASHVIYHWMVPHDMPKLIELTGGTDASEKRLDFLFEKLDDLYDGEHFAACNEPGFGVPWSYNWTNAPQKTCSVVNRILNEVYSTGIDGVPGNDDLGAMGSWYTFACLGLYPYISGVGGFATHCPIFEEIVLHLPGGDVLISGGDNSQTYHSKILVNGRPVQNHWIDWEQICNGGKIEFK